MKIKLVHLLCRYFILIVIIDIFSPAYVGQPESQFNFKVGRGTKSGKGSGKFSTFFQFGVLKSESLTLPQHDRARLTHIFRIVVHEKRLSQNC